jgi:alpha-glucosidase
MVHLRHAAIAAFLFVTVTGGPLAQTAPSLQQKPAATRRSQRVQMPAIDVRSPNGQVAFSLLPNAERLTFTVTLGDAAVIEPSPIVLTLDGYDLSAGVVYTGVARDEVHERYPWSGARTPATSDSHRARLSLTNDLTSIAYTLEVRAFDDGVAYRHIIPGDAAASRVPDEWSTFNLPAGSTVWYAGMAEGHYEAPYVKADLAAVQAGQWAGPPLTFRLPQSGGYASITEANLVNYSGMGLESNGRGGWVIGLGHRQPLNYPFELRYGREEGRRPSPATSRRHGVW